VTDPATGWTDFRPFDPQIFQHLRAAHSCTFLWSSATCGEEMLNRICEVFSVPREEVAVLCMSSDRPNIFMQRRITKKALSLGCVQCCNQHGVKSISG
jgi:superfamily II DNA helicase RecQ